MFAIASADEFISLQVAATLLHFVWQGAAIAALVVMGGWLFRHASARTRYAINVTALLAMALCLPVTFSLVEVTTDGVHEEATTGFVPEIQPQIATGIERGSATPLLDVAPEHRDALAMPIPGVQRDTVFRVDRSETESVMVATSGGIDLTRSLIQDAFLRYAPWLTWAWLVGVLLMTIRLAMGLWGGHRLRRSSSSPSDNEFVDMVTKQARAVGLRVAPGTAFCTEISIPIVLGVVRPMILLPASLTTGLSSDQLQALVTHELAHIRRYDLLINLLQRVIEAILFFHPAVWFVSRRISVERENVADDMVVDAGWTPTRYADALVRMAELSSSLRHSRFASQVVALAASGVSGSEFKRRIVRLLERSDRPRLCLTRSGLVAMGLVAILLIATPVVVQSRADATNPEPTESVNDDPDDSAGQGSDGKLIEAQKEFDALVAADHWRDRRAASKRIGELGDIGLQILLKGIEHNDDDVRESCFTVLQEKFAKHPKAVDAFIQSLSTTGDSNPATRIRYSNAFHLGSYGVAKAADALRDVYQNNKDLKLTAAKSLAQLGHTDGFPLLYDKLGSDHYMERYQANLGIEALGGRDLNDFGDYRWDEGAVVTGGVEVKLSGRSAEQAKLKAKRYAAIASYHEWLKSGKPELFALLNPADDSRPAPALEPEIVECHVSGGDMTEARATVRLSVADKLSVSNLSGEKVLKEIVYPIGEDGRYTIEVPGDLAANPKLQISVSISHPRLLDRSMGPVPFGALHKPRTQDRASLGVYQDMQRQAILTTRLRKGQQIKGQVLRPDGTPAPAAIVKTATKYQAYSWKFFSPDDYGFSSTVKTSDDGQFSLEVDHRATLTVSLPGHATLLIDDLTNYTELTDGEPLLTLRLPRPVRLSGKVLDDKGDPVPRAIVVASRHFAWNEFNMPLAFRTSCAANEKGEYEFPPLPADSYKVTASDRLPDNIKVADYNAHIMGRRPFESSIKTEPLGSVFVTQVRTLELDKPFPRYDLKAEPVAVVLVEVEFPDGPPKSDRGTDVGITGKLNGENWYGRYVRAGPNGLARLSAPKGLTDVVIKTGLARHRRSPDAKLEIGRGIHFERLDENLDGITVIKPDFAQLKVKLTLPKELSRKYSESKAFISITAEYERQGYGEQSPKKQRMILTGSTQSGPSSYSGVALPDEPIMLKVSVKENDETKVVYHQRLVLKPGEERIHEVAIGGADADETGAAADSDEIKSALEKEAEDALQKAVKFLISRQRADGSWQSADGNQQFSIGMTAQAALALRNSGVQVDDAIRRATTFLIKAKPRQTKEVALQTLLLHGAGEVGAVVCRRNVKWLVDAQQKTGPDAGSWGYLGSDTGLARGDGANTAYAIRALSEVALGEADGPNAVPPDVWMNAVQWLLKCQNADGGWGYVPRASQSTGSMTVCALAGLNDLLPRVTANREAVDEAIMRGKAWLAARWTIEQNPGGQAWRLFYLNWATAALNDDPDFAGRAWYPEVLGRLHSLQGTNGSFLGETAASTRLVSTALAIEILRHRSNRKLLLPK